ncbi:MAG: ComF family protein [Acidobacteria bacterium]|nr:ComF family protein [Acidobacteriota bacterium]
MFKFERRAEIGAVLGALLAVMAREAFAPGEWDAVAPVPLHRSRRRLRGYNPAERLARPLARRLGLPLLRRALRRTRPTPPQTGLPRRERLRNVRGAFRAPRPGRVQGRRILLVDDILTTGATAAECSRELLRAGAASVDLITAARSFPDRFDSPGNRPVE